MEDLNRRNAAMALSEYSEERGVEPTLWKDTEGHLLDDSEVVNLVSGLIGRFLVVQGSAGAQAINVIATDEAWIPLRVREVLERSELEMGAYKPIEDPRECERDVALLDYAVRRIRDMLVGDELFGDRCEVQILLSAAKAHLNLLRRVCSGRPASTRACACLMRVSRSCGARPGLSKRERGAPWPSGR